MNLNGVMAVIYRHFTESGGFMDNYVKVVKVIDLHCHSGTEIILYYAIWGSTRV